MTPAQRRTWQDLQVVTEHLRREVGRDLWNDAQLSDAEFTVLAHLSTAPGGMRPSECSRAIDWDSSRLAHQVRRLQGRGFVARSAGGGDDGRAVLLSLTDEGRHAYRRALGPHLRSARRWFADALTDEQMTALDDVLQAVLAHGDRLTGRRDPDSTDEEQR